jgi:S-formylglutathione hydrolase FrmB
MALAHLHFYSQTLGKQTAAEVLLPDSGKGPFPVFYLLHGLSDDHTIWLRRTRIEMYISAAPLIVVMPNGDRGFYTDANEGHSCGRFIGEELPAVIDNYFPTKRSRDGRAIGGLSMGGYGALRAALAYPDTFVSANSLSGAVLAGTQRWDKPHDRLNNAEFQRIFGAKPAGTKHDLLTLAKGITRRKLPKLRIDCGTEDFLINDNREFCRKLEALKIPHEYEEFPGAHNWDYWDLHIREALAFHAKHLGL